MVSWLRRMPLVAAAVMVLAGCTSDEGSERVLGDLATIEPCSLTDPEVFAEFGTAEFGTPESLSYCTVIVEPVEASTANSFARNAPEEVTIIVGQLTRPSIDESPPTDKLEDVTDSIYTTQPDDTGVSCGQKLVFAEADLALSVRSRLPPAASPFPTCDMVTTGTTKIVEVILAGKIEHRSPAPNSLISLDPCDLVSDETIATVPGFTAAQRENSPDRHTCRWSTPTGLDESISVTFGVAEPPTLPKTDYLGGNTDPIAGRPSVTTHTDRICTVETGHIPFDDPAGATGFVETVKVIARQPSERDNPTSQPNKPYQPDATSCNGALTVVKALWPQLPSP